MLSRLLIPALWIVASWLFFVMFIVVLTFPFGILGQVRYLFVSIPDPCSLSFSFLLPFLSYFIILILLNRFTEFYSIVTPGSANFRILKKSFGCVFS